MVPNVRGKAAQPVAQPKVMHSALGAAPDLGRWDKGKAVDKVAARHKGGQVFPPAGTLTGTALRLLANWSNAVEPWIARLKMEMPPGPR